MDTASNFQKIYIYAQKLENFSKLFKKNRKYLANNFYYFGKKQLLKHLPVLSQRFTGTCSSLSL